jgi:hypothetical protein
MQFQSPFIIVTDKGSPYDARISLPVAAIREIVGDRGGGSVVYLNPLYPTIDRLASTSPERYYVRESVDELTKRINILTCGQSGV